MTTVYLKKQCALLLSHGSALKSRMIISIGCVWEGEKKPKATDQSLLTYRKEQTPKITQIFPLFVRPVKIILAL